METPAYESVETRESLLVQLAALTAERDALAALLKEARALVRAWDEPESHDPDAALEALRAALARIDAASGRGK